MRARQRRRTAALRARRLVRISLVAGLAGLAAGCGTSGERGKAQQPVATAATTAAGGRYKVGKPYQIKGIWYYPAIDYDYVEEGVASWYGPGFHGKLTANGEVYDQNDMTAAHRTLPMPSIVRVTNLDNGRSLKLTVNDRGPFARERIIDVSRRASQLLGFHQAGTARVRVEIEADESRQIALAMTGSEYPGQAQLAGRQRAPAAAAAPVLAAVPEPAVEAAFQPAPALVAAAEPFAAAAVPVEPIAVGAAAADPVPLDPVPLDPVALDAVPLDPVALEVPPIDPATTPADPLIPLPPLADAPPPATGFEVAPVAMAAEPVGATPFASSARAWIQAGAFAQRANAERARAQLRALGPVAVTPSSAGGRDLYRVRVGPLPFDDADRLLAQVVRSGFPGSHVIVE